MTTMKKSLIILHDGFFSLYFPAGVLKPASSIGSEYRLSFQKGEEKKGLSSQTNKQKNNDHSSLCNVPVGIPAETDTNPYDNITRVSIDADAKMLNKVIRTPDSLIL